MEVEAEAGVEEEEVRLRVLEPRAGPVTQAGTGVVLCVQARGTELVLCLCLLEPRVALRQTGGVTRMSHSRSLKGEKVGVEDVADLDGGHCVLLLQWRQGEQARKAQEVVTSLATGARIPCLGLIPRTLWLAFVCAEGLVAGTGQLPVRWLGPGTEQLLPGTQGLLAWPPYPYPYLADLVCAGRRVLRLLF